MFFNPVIISVITMIILCLLNLNVILAILVSAIVAGLVAGIPVTETMNILIGGMGGNSETALSYILLGALAIAVNKTGLATILAQKISKSVGGKKSILLLTIAVIACFSQNLIPVHIAFIPILIPPLLKLMNQLKLDRRGAACALTFGLKAPYITLPVGFGLIFHGIIRDQMAANGIDLSLDTIFKSVWILGLAMLIGLLTALFISYSKDRVYKDSAFENQEKDEDIKFSKKHYITLASVAVAFIVQLTTGSLPLGAIIALALMIATKVLDYSKLDDVMSGGIGIMGFIAFVMLVAAGFGDVIRATDSIEPLVSGVTLFVGGSKVLGALLMLLVGLFVTMGIGTSFGTIPILAAIYCPLALNLGFSYSGIVVLIAAAGALGDAGSPASDSTLGPTAGLNADGQHNHIWDTCVPTFLHFNIPLIIFGVLGSIIL